jgi:Transposase DDE domain/Transposase domain (DUF772)
MRWSLPVGLSERERSVAKHLQRVGRFYVFLREVLPKLFDEAFQEELARAYGRPRGTEPIPPALLAAVTLLQAYEQTSDADAVVTAKMDKRWQLVLGCLGSDDAPFSQGVLPEFRQRMIEHELDRKLLDRTVELAKETGKFGWQKLKVILDSSPLLGAGRVEDTWNLIGRALSTVVNCAGASLSMPREQILREAGLTLLSGSSLKAALDIDWDDSEQQAEALQRLLAEVDALESWVARRAGEKAQEALLQEALQALRRVLAQDLEPDPKGGKRIRRGVAKDRMPSLGDREMRHGRKSKSKCFNGYKRHLLTLSGTDLIAAALVRPANEPEYVAAAPLLADAQRHGETEELLIDRGYLASPVVETLRRQGVAIVAKPWASRNGGRFTKQDFQIDLPRGKITCPAGEHAKVGALGSVVRFPASVCAPCELRPRCTTASPQRGRSLAIHEQEDLLIQLRALKKTSAGRAALRKRVAVEHSLARMRAIQGIRARYKGTRKNTLDLRRCATVANLQTIARAA